MFEFLRKHSKVVMWAVLIFVGAPFVFVYGVSSQLGKSRKIELVVYGHEVSATEFMAEKRMVDLFSQNRSLRDDVLDSRTKQNLTLYYKALDAGVRASDAMVAKAISKFSPFLSDGKFEKRFYTNFLKRFNMTKAGFEEGMRRRLTVQMFTSILRGSVRVGDTDIREDFKRKNQTANLVSVTVASKDYESKVKLGDGDIENYYNSNKDLFKQEAEVKIEYVLAWANDYEESVVVDEKEVKKFYDNTKDPRFIDKEKSTDGKKIFKEYAKVRDEIEEQIKKSKARELSKKAISDLHAKLISKEASWDKLAKEANVIHEISPFFGASKISGQKFGWARIDFNAPEEKVSDVIQSIDIAGGMKMGQLVYRVLAKKDAIIPKLDAIKEEVKKKLIVDKAKELANFEMQELRKSYINGDFIELSKTKGLKTVEHNEVPYNSLGVDGDVLYALKNGEISEVMSQPVTVSAGVECSYKVFKMIKHNPIDEDDFAKKKEEIKRSLINAKSSKFIQVLSAEVTEENKKLP